MIPLRPNGKIDLTHRGSFLRGTPGRSVVVAAAEDGCLSIVKPDFSEAQPRSCSTLRAISPHPSAPWLAMIENGSGWLIVQTIQGDQVVKIPPTVIGTSPNWIKLGFADCHFDESGDFLWLAASRSAEECEVDLVETKNWALVDRVIVKDPFGGSFCFFHDSGQPGLIALWLGAGQNGQQVYWLKREHNRFRCDVEPRLENTIPPIFSPTGEELLVITDDGIICKYAFPELEQVGSPLESGDDENQFAESLVYLNERQALASTNEGRVFLVDTTRMIVEDEVAIEGHEPRPIGEYYPSLSHEGGLCTNISWFTKLGNIVLFVYRRDRGIDLEDWKDSLLWYATP